MEAPDGGLGGKTSVDGAEFWLSGASSDNGSLSHGDHGEGSIRMILTVADPDALFTQIESRGIRGIPCRRRIWLEIGTAG